MSSGLSRRREGSICKPAAEELFIASYRDDGSQKEGSPHLQKLRLEENT